MLKERASLSALTSATSASSAVSTHTKVAYFATTVISTGFVLSSTVGL
jgi:hypothetical protein